MSNSACTVPGFVISGLPSLPQMIFAIVPMRETTLSLAFWTYASSVLEKSFLEKTSVVDYPA